jgi:hypothetical protein
MKQYLLVCVYFVYIQMMLANGIPPQRVYAGHSDEVLLEPRPLEDEEKRKRPILAERLKEVLRPRPWGCPRHHHQDAEVCREHPGVRQEGPCNEHQCPCQQVRRGRGGGRKSKRMKQMILKNLRNMIRKNTRKRALQSQPTRKLQLQKQDPPFSVASASTARRGSVQRTLQPQPMRKTTARPRQKRALQPQPTGKCAPPRCASCTAEICVLTLASLPLPPQGSLVGRGST